MDKQDLKQLAEHDVKIEDLESRLNAAEGKIEAGEKKEIIREWLYTKCIWVWTGILGWCFAMGAFVADHYDKISIVVIAGLKALKESSK